VTRRTRDPVASYNERVKLMATSVNALGLGVLAYGLLRPLVETQAVFELGVAVWTAVGLVLHGISHYILTQISRGEDLDRI